MRSPTTALVLLILASACTPDADTPTSVSPSPPPDRALFRPSPGESDYLFDSYYDVSFDTTSGSAAVTQAEQAAVEEAFDSLAIFFSNANEELPEFDVVYGQTGDIQIKFDGNDPDAYYCGAGGGGEITLTRRPFSATDCGVGHSGQLTSQLTGLIMHEFGEELGVVSLADVDLVSTDFLYEKCVWPHYSSDKDSGYPSQLCWWDEQWVYALYELRPVPPEDFYENSLIVDVDVTASKSTMFRDSTVTFTASLTQWNGNYQSSAAAALKTWWKSAGSWESAPDDTAMSVVASPGEVADTLIVGAIVDDSLGYAIWPWPEAEDTVLVVLPPPTSVTLPDSLELTDDSDSTLYRDLEAVTTPADPNELYDYEWTISNTNIAHIVGSGRTVTIEGYSRGTAIVIVEVEDTVSDTTTVVVDCGTKWNPSCIQYGPSPM